MLPHTRGDDPTLTWRGHEFLDAVRSDGVWSKVKSRVAKTVGTAGLETIHVLATKLVSEVVLG